MEMNLRLDNFERQIDRTILNRGLDYFRRGCVEELEDLGHGDYVAEVYGSEKYTVRLHVEGKDITEYSCDCPYDRGPVCKHVAAVLYCLADESDDDADEMVHSKRSAPKSSGHKKLSDGEKLDEILGRLSSDELKSFVRMACSEDRRLRKSFLFQYASLLYPESKEFYSEQIRNLEDSFSDCYGFLDYHDASALGMELLRLLDDAFEGMGKGRERKALYIAEAVIEEMEDIIYNSDDSSGDMGMAVERAFEILSGLAGMELDASLHDEMFGWLLAGFEKGMLKSWDWHFDLLEVAVMLMKTETEKERIKSVLAQVRPSGERWDSNWRRAQGVMLKIILKTEGESEAVNFMEADLTNPDFRKELISRAIKGHDYKKAEKLALDGIKKDEDDFPGLADEWRNSLLQVYLAVDDRKHAMKIARHFLIQPVGSSSHPRKYYYDLLKTLVSPDMWSGYIDDAIAEIERDSRYGSLYWLISQLYIWEEQWDRLLALLCRYPEFSRVEEAEKYLAKDHAEELASMYRDLILSYMKSNMGRKHYQTVCRYIRRMIKLGARPMAVDLVEQLRTMYRNRRALIEELAHLEIP